MSLLVHTYEYSQNGFNTGGLVRCLFTTHPVPEGIYDPDFLAYNAQEVPNHCRRVYLNCPYCGTQIGQDYKVECPCGWKAKALPDRVIEAIKRQARELYGISEDKWKCWTINNFDWFEIEPGKRGDE